MRKKYALLLLPVLMWLFLLFILSSQSYEQQSIKPLLNDHLSKQKISELLPNLTIRYHHNQIEAKQDPFSFIEFFFRKGAHLFVYAMLAFLVYTAMLPYREKTVWKVILVLLSIALAAVADEWNQMNSPFRTGAVQDVGIDLIGGSIGLLAAAVFYKFIAASFYTKTRK